MAKVILQVQDVSVHFADVTALKHVNLSFEEGKIYAIVGCNGSGKTVLTQTITGQVRDYEGDILLEGRPVRFRSLEDAYCHGIALSPQTLSVIENFSIADNLFHAVSDENKRNFLLNRKRIYKKTEETLERLHIGATPGTLVSSLSHADKYMIQLAKTIAENPKIIILDEPSASMTIREQAVVFELLRDLRARGATILYVTNDLRGLETLADGAYVLAAGEVTHTLKNVTNEVLFQAVFSKSATLRYPRLTAPKGKLLLSARRLQNHALSDISLDLWQGEILGIAGIAGSGRSQLLKALIFETKLTEGYIYYPMLNLKHQTVEELCHFVGYLSENWETQSLYASLSQIQNVTIRNLGKVSGAGIINLQNEELHARLMLEKLGIKYDGSKTDVRDLSSGIRQRIVLCQCLFSRCGLYIFDEPTQNIDAAGKVELYNIINALACKGAGIIIASSDYAELAGMCDRILVLRDGAMVAELSDGEITSQRLMDCLS